MENLALKIRIAMLWIFMAVAKLLSATIFIMEPGGLEEMVSELAAMGPGILFVPIYYLVALAMAILSVTLKDSANRRANIILGIVFTGLNIVGLIEQLAQPTAHQILMAGSAFVATALIFWYAWKWPKQVA